MMISNVAVFCCQIVAIILALYSAIFYHHESAATNPHAVVAFVYVYWLGVSVFVLCLAASAWLPIIVNHALSVYRTFIILIGLYGFGPVEQKPVRTKAQQNEIPIERNPIRTTIRQKERPTERKAQFEPVYNRLCVETVFAASVNVTTETQ